MESWVENRNIPPQTFDFKKKDRGKVSFLYIGYREISWIVFICWAFKIQVVDVMETIRRILKGEPKVEVIPKIPQFKKKVTQAMYLFSPFYIAPKYDQRGGVYGFSHFWNFFLYITSFRATRRFLGTLKIATESLESILSDPKFWSTCVDLLGNISTPL